MNFSVPAGAPSFTGNGTIGGVCPAGAGCEGNDGTRFYELKENIGGVNYWHVIVGEESSGFAFEFYTRASGSAGIENFNGFSPDSGGMERASYSNADFCTGNGAVEGMCGSGADPFNNSNSYNYSGTGTGDGSKMAMRMVMDYGDGMSLEVFKPFTDRKPLITQTVIDGDLRSEFVSDMRALSYSDMSSAAPVSNRQAIDDPTMPQPGAGDFDMSMAQDTSITAGRFIFTPGSGWNTTGGWRASNSSFDEGVYTYAKDSFDVLNTPWAEFFNYSDNVTPCNTGHRKDPTMNGDPGGPDDSCPGRP